ncbi:MAG: tetratricopeptide repeat protein [Spirochaetales bacterium]|nr:tetratricopeptide repeat protein [Spirochaetales bacterium]
MNLPNRKLLEQEYETDRKLYELILQNLGQKFQTWLEPLAIHPGIKIRVKTFKSWFDKVLRKIRQGVPAEQVQIHDVLGLRIVCPFMEDIKKIEDVIRTRLKVLEEEKKGSIQSFKEFGYESTHFLVSLPQDLVEDFALASPPPCEIQVRTILQDAWAEVEHELIYKSQFFPFDQPLKRKLAALNANLTLSDIIFQEIRDYQRQLNHELDKRRRSFLERLKNTPAIESAARNNEDHYASLPAENMDQVLLDALTAHNLKQYKKAINHYTAILKRGPQSFVQSLVLTHRGMAYFAEGLYENALDDFDAAVDRDSTNSKAFYYRGLVKSSMEEYEAAILDFTRSLEMVPFQFEVLLARSRAWAKTGNPARALQDCEAALNLAPDDPEVQALQKDLVLEKKLGT